MMKGTEVTRIAVVGVGTIGSFAIEHLAKQPGVTVVGFERYAPGHDLAAAGGENRFFTNALLLHERYQSLLEQAFSRWKTLEEQAQKQILFRYGHLTVAQKYSSEAKHLVNKYADSSLPIEFVRNDDLKNRFDFQQYAASDIGIYDPTGGAIRTDLALTSVSQIAASHGAEIRSYTNVLSILENQSHIEIITDQGSEAFDQVLVTAGAWSNQLLPSLRSQINVHRPVSAWFLPKHENTLPEAFCPTERLGEQQYYAAPAFDRQTVKFGYGGIRQKRIEAEPEPSDYMFDWNREDHEFTEIIESYFPYLLKDPVRVKPYFEGYTDSTDPIMQRVNERLVVASGFSGRGFKFAPIFGEKAAKMILETT